MRTNRFFLLTSILVFVLAIVLFACGGGDDDDDDNDDAAAPTWENFAQGFFADYCTRCHSSELAGVDRVGAPPGVDFDTYDGAVADAADARERAGVGESMPPDATKPTQAERDRLTAWVDADTPEN
ncbi:MAG: hypothetical protein P9L99_17800 [Candidatus Lernaella stagnicola]|nr:hypothetical protein [Candidatus Lernaella stagnicola]